MPKNASSNLKGKIFEWFVKEILKSCGFIEVKPDKFILYTGGTGLMIHGLGQSHNADVLMDPPFQIPFYFPSRLLVECKAYKDKIRLPIVRNILGFREDINNFEIITEEILKGRKNYKRTAILNHNYSRYFYQVALASVNELTIIAQEFALTHHIPIISFAFSKRYNFFRNFLENINKNFLENINEKELNKLFKYFKNEIFEKPYFAKEDVRIKISNFIDESKKLFECMHVGVLDDGSIIFLYSAEKDFMPSDKQIEINSEIQKDKDNKSNWKIALSDYGNKKFYFELPEEIYNEWADSRFDKMVAIEEKEKHFKHIYVFGKNSNNKFVFFILNLDKDFVKEAKGKLGKT
ncbi:hypothetical protein KAJ61_02620 [Candidatus Parcubacteria bacterium]|nr:hypothetical protein [Candidatus Parcubacteria bacterium]